MTSAVRLAARAATTCPQRASELGCGRSGGATAASAAAATCHPKWPPCTARSCPAAVTAADAAAASSCSAAKAAVEPVRGDTPRGRPRPARSRSVRPNLLAALHDLTSPRSAAAATKCFHIDVATVGWSAHLPNPPPPPPPPPPSPPPLPWPLRGLPSSFSAWSALSVSSEGGGKGGGWHPAAAGGHQRVRWRGRRHAHWRSFRPMHRVGARRRLGQRWDVCGGGDRWRGGGGGKRSGDSRGR